MATILGGQQKSSYSEAADLWILELGGKITGYFVFYVLGIGPPGQLVGHSVRQDPGLGRLLVKPNRALLALFSCEVIHSIFATAFFTTWGLKQKSCANELCMLFSWPGIRQGSFLLYLLKLQTITITISSEYSLPPCDTPTVHQPNSYTPPEQSEIEHCVYLNGCVLQ